MYHLLFIDPFYTADPSAAAFEMEELILPSLIQMVKILSKPTDISLFRSFISRSRVGAAVGVGSQLRAPITALCCEVLS